MAHIDVFSELGGLSDELRAAQRIVVLGVGNVGRGDDGAGLLAAAALKKKLGQKGRPRLKVLLGHETPESLTGEIRRFRPGLVLILDAAVSRKKPGSVFLLGKKDMAVEDISSHRMPLALLADYLEKSVGCRVLVLAIEPRSCREKAPLSAAVKKAVEKLSSQLAAVLAERPTRRIPCRVVFYSGYKGQETPRTIRLKDRELKVLEVLERKRVQDSRRKMIAEVFTCRLEEGRAQITVTSKGCRLSIPSFDK
ncbi:MAG: hydrogenase maturation protease [Candidatus Aminicenantales bacterium]